LASPSFFALPVAAVVQSFLSTFPKRHEVVESELTKLREPKPAKPPKPARAHRFRTRRGRPGPEVGVAEAIHPTPLPKSEQPDHWTKLPIPLAWSSSRHSRAEAITQARNRSMVRDGLALDWW
jgi:hypothetical protein